MFATAVVAIWVPETKGKGLDEIEMVFERRRERTPRQVFVEEGKKLRRGLERVRKMVGLDAQRIGSSGSSETGVELQRL